MGRGKKKRVEFPEGIMQRVADGDGEAFEELYYLTYKPLFSALLSMTGSREDAADLMQDTYIKVRAGAGLYKTGNLMAWIIKIGQNEFLMKKRKEKNFSSVQFEDNRDSLEKYKIADSSVYVEDRLFLENLMSKLDDRSREILILHGAVGLTHREVADVLGIPIGTAITKYHKALKILRETENTERRSKGENIS